MQETLSRTEAVQILDKTFKRVKQTVGQLQRRQRNEVIGQLVNWINKSKHPNDKFSQEYTLWTFTDAAMDYFDDFKNQDESEVDFFVNFSPFKLDKNGLIDFFQSNTNCHPDILLKDEPHEQSNGNPLGIISNPLFDQSVLPDMTTEFANDLRKLYLKLMLSKPVNTQADQLELVKYYAIDCMLHYKQMAMGFLPGTIVQQISEQMWKAGVNVFPNLSNQHDNYLFDLAKSLTNPQIVEIVKRHLSKLANVI